MSDFPKFLIGDNSEFPNDIFIVHTHYPSFVLNVSNDDVEWLEEFDVDEVDDISDEMDALIEEAYKFYDREMEKFEE